MNIIEELAAIVDGRAGSRYSRLEWVELCERAQSALETAQNTMQGYEKRIAAYVQTIGDLDKALTEYRDGEPAKLRRRQVEALESIAESLRFMNNQGITVETT